MSELSPLSFFASKSIAMHLLRGVAAVTLIVYAYRIGDDQPALSIVAGIAAVVMLRGCPACWMIGLIETIRQQGRPH
jgi:hypothetical protein